MRGDNLEYINAPPPMGRFQNLFWIKPEFRADSMQG